MLAAGNTDSEFKQNSNNALQILGGAVNANVKLQRCSNRNKKLWLLTNLKQVFQSLRK